MFKGPKSGSTGAASHEEVKEGAAASGISGFRKVTDSISASASLLESSTIVGKDKRMLSGMNMQLTQKSKPS